MGLILTKYVFYDMILSVLKKGDINMTTFNVLIDSINSVKTFVNTVSKYDYEIDLTSGRYIIDAKSIMGIFSLDLSQPIKVDAHTDDASSLMEELKAFIC